MWTRNDVMRLMVKRMRQAHPSSCHHGKKTKRQESSRRVQRWWWQRCVLLDVERIWTWWNLMQYCFCKSRGQMSSGIQEGEISMSYCGVGNSLIQRSRYLLLEVQRGGWGGGEVGGGWADYEEMIILLSPTCPGLSGPGGKGGMGCLIILCVMSVYL